MIRVREPCRTLYSPMMNCPLHGAPLESKSAGTRSVPTCPRCGGMFLDHGELNRIAEPTAGDLEFSTVDGDSFQHDDRYGPIACPRDGTPMVKVDFNIETAIILDYCTHCRGFWLDADELTQINAEVRRLNEAGEEVPDPLLLRIFHFFDNIPLPR